MHAYVNTIVPCLITSHNAIHVSILLVFVPSCNPHAAFYLASKWHQLIVTDVGTEREHERMLRDKLVYSPFTLPHRGHCTNNGNITKLCKPGTFLCLNFLCVSKERTGNVNHVIIRKRA